MTAPIVTLAAAVVTELTTPESPTTWSQTLTIARKYRIRRDLKDINATAWLVDVVASEETSEIINRAALQSDTEIDIAIHKKCNPDSTSDVDAVLNLQHEIATYWIRRQATGTTQKCFRFEKRALWVPRHLEEDRCCTSVVRLTFKNIA